MIVKQFFVVYIINSVNAVNLRLDKQGYENRTFHLVVMDFDGDLARINVDITEELLARNDDILLQRSVTKLGRQLLVLKYWSVVPATHYFNEHCSINVVVQMEGIFTSSLLSIFGSRVYDPNNIFILIFDEKSINCECALRIQVDDLILAAINRLCVSSEDSEIKSATSFCSTCSPALKITAIPFSELSSLSRIQQFSNQIKLASTENTILAGSLAESRLKGCSYLYKKRKTTNPKWIGCSPANLFVEISAAYLNWSVQPSLSEITTKMMIDGGMNLPWAVIASFDMTRWLEHPVPISNLVEIFYQGNHDLVAL